MAENKLVAMLPEEFREDFAPLISSDHLDPQVHRIVKDADTLCAYIKPSVFYATVAFNKSAFTQVIL